MKLIFITRILDKKDTRSGFVFDWVGELSKNVDKLLVFCQEKGELGEIPSNIEVYSFGKDLGYGRLRQFFAFWGLLFKFCKNSSGIFAHMHPVYVVFAWLPAKVFGKKITLWYTHKSVTLLLRLATALTSTVFTASKESFRLLSKKVKIVGHGISLARFQDARDKKQLNSKFQILSIGRISPSKNYEFLIKAVAQLPSNNYQLHIYGDPALESDKDYLKSLRSIVNELHLENVVFFHPGVSYDNVPGLYSNANLFVNLSSTGSVDKTVLESAASKVLVFTSNEAFYKVLEKISPLLVGHNDPESVASKIISLVKTSPTQRAALTSSLYKWVEDNHSLERLAKIIVSEYEKVA